MRTKLRKLPPSQLEEFRGWGKLKAQEQVELRAEDKGLSEDLYMEGQSRMAVGKRLLKISNILAPYRLFGSFLRKRFHMTKSTAYNYINLFKSANKDAPKMVLDIAMQRNYRIINRPEVFKTYPPPKTEDPVKIVEYLDKLEARKPKVISIHKNSDGLLRQALHSVEICWNQLPADPKVRTKWYKSLIGMQLTKFGVDREVRFMPEEIPESMIVVRGRPKEKSAA